MTKEENIVCPNCGTVLVKGTKKCVKCKKVFSNNKKSCPKCAKRNDINAKKCISCGYNFTSKKPNILFNVIISVLSVVCLFILINLEYTDMVKTITLALKVLASILILFLLYKNINYGYKDIIKYEQREKLNNIEIPKKIENMKKISSLFIIIAGVLVLVILIIYYFVKR